MDPRNNDSPLHIALTDVESSQLAAYGYDVSSRTLAIRFNPKAGTEIGPLYHYFDVEPETAEAMSNAVSKGTFFYAHVKAKYDFRKVEPDLEDAMERMCVFPAAGTEGGDDAAGTEHSQDQTTQQHA